MEPSPLGGAKSFLTGEEFTGTAQSHLAGPYRGCTFVATSPPTYRHWIDELVDNIIEYWGSADTINCSCGLSISGLQHVGRLRGEVIITNTVMHLLREHGKKTRHTIVRYTSDEWKGKPQQLAQFPDPEEAKQYIGRRLVDVPDPKGELDSWVDRYWQDFGCCLDDFSRDAQVLSTTEIYQWPQMQELVRQALEKRELVRQVVNRYRTRSPRPEGWIPVDVVCDNCLRISSTIVLDVDLDAYTADYQCSACGYEGTTSITRGKLSWRVEWAAIWKVLEVGFEPFGKDHATPGGSRDSAKEVAERVFQFKPPFPYAYEWVGIIEGGVDQGDMGSSDFRGFTPRDWLSVASGESLRYLFLKNRPMKRVTLGLEYVPTYEGQYDRAERVYYGLDKASQGEAEDIRRTYQLARLTPPPPKPPIQIPYLHAALLSQILPKENTLEAALERLSNSGLIPKKLTKEERAYIALRLERAGRWVRLYAPPNQRIQLLDQPPPGLANQVTPRLRTLFQQLLDRLDPDNWTEEAIREAMKQVTSPLRKDPPTQREFFRLIYQAFFGRDAGPRIAPFLALNDPNLALSRLRYLATPPTNT